jgi:hypothetical protein
MKLSYRQILYALNSEDPLGTIVRWKNSEKVIEGYGLKVGPVWEEQYYKEYIERREEDV